MVKTPLKGINYTGILRASSERATRWYIGVLSMAHVGIQSLGKGTLSRVVGATRDYGLPGRLGLIGLGRLSLSGL